MMILTVMFSLAHLFTPEGNGLRRLLGCWVAVQIRRGALRAPGVTLNVGRGLAPADL